MGGPRDYFTLPSVISTFSPTASFSKANFVPEGGALKPSTSVLKLCVSAGKTSQPPIMPSGRTQPGMTARAYEPSSLARSKFTLTSGISLT